jgi:hypothetical protein
MIRGKGMGQRDQEQGREIIRRLAEQGVIPAMIEYAQILDREKHFDEAIFLFRTCFEKGIAEAYDYAGRIEEKRHRFEEAKQFYAKGGDMGSFNWARLTLDRDSADEGLCDTAMKTLHHLATQGHVPSLMSPGEHSVNREVRSGKERTRGG